MRLAAMSPRSLLDPLRHALKRRKHKAFKLHIWTMDDIGLGYVSTPKVASNAIRRLIRKRQAKLLFDIEEDMRRDREFKKKNKEFKAKMDREIKRVVTPSQIAAMKGEMYFFSFVRNPLARLYSCYRDKVVNAPAFRDHCTLSPYGIEFGMSFGEFVHRIAEIPDSESNEHFRSLHTFLTYQGASFVDYVGKIEHLKEDWLPLSEKYALECPQRDENSKRVSGPSIPSIELPYTRETAEIAVERYAHDIELYDYSSDIERLMEHIRKTAG